MKTLIVHRHAKAEPHATGGDFVRTLTRRGEEDAGAAGKQVASIVSTPDLIVSSDAARALSTARMVAAATGYRAKLREDHGIYEAAVDDLLAVVRGLPSSAESVVLVGHNPGLEGLVQTLVNGVDGYIGLGTANFATIELDVDEWADVDKGGGRVIGTYAPDR